MKTKELIYIGVILVLLLFHYLQYTHVRHLKAEITTLETLTDIDIKKHILAHKRAITDSLQTEYNNRPPLIITETQIQTRYETITDTILLLPDSLQWPWIRSELSRIYPD